jgi:hypothetical protein
MYYSKIKIIILKKTNNHVHLNHIKEPCIDIRNVIFANIETLNHAFTHVLYLIINGVIKLCFIYKNLGYLFHRFRLQIDYFD